MLKTVLRSPITAAVLLVAAIALLVFGSLGVARAVPRIISNNYQAEAQLTNIHVALTENDIVRENFDNANGVHSHEKDTQYAHSLLLSLVPKDEKFEVGHTYPEKLAVRNMGKEGENGIEQNVRVTVTKYWVGADGKKDVTLDPSLIDLHFVEGASGWTIDKDASTDERVVLYCSKVLLPQSGDRAETDEACNSDYFTDTLTIKPEVLTARASDGTLAYKGKSFEIKAVVDAVQTHNSSDARTGAWGLWL